MNRFFFLLAVLSLVSATNADAQKIMSAKVAAGGGGATQMPIAQVFLGTWEWHSGNETFRIVLTRDPAYTFVDGTSHSVILGRHSYTKNGVVIEETISTLPTVAQARSLFTIPREEWKLTMNFQDQAKQKMGEAKMTIDPSNPNQMSFVLHDQPGVFTLNSPHTVGFTVPTSVILTRVQ